MAEEEDDKLDLPYSDHVVLLKLGVCQKHPVVSHWMFTSGASGVDSHCT
jgi:hypothetical protein